MPITMKWTSVIIAFVLIGCVCGDIDSDITNLLSNTDDLKLPGLEGFDTSQFNLSQAPTLEDAERLFKEKCLKNADMAAYERAQGAKDVAKECVLSLVNITVLQEEMEIAKPTGDLDTVFRKYCRKSPLLRQCVSNFTASMEPCLDEGERESKHLIQNITDSLVQFVCFKEGDRIALFIAEGGPECLQAHQEGIQECINSTFSKHLPKSVPSVNDLPSFILRAEECGDIRVLQRCVVQKLESCREPTPANIVESMFNFIYKVTPCAKLTQASLTTGQRGVGQASSAGPSVQSTLLFVSALSLLAACWV